MTLAAPSTLAAAVMIALAVTGCSRNYFVPDPASCKAAMQAQYLKAAAGQGRFGTEPANCKGLPKAQVQLFERQITAGH